MKGTIALLLATASLAALPAGACLNDRRVYAAENEFKSSYIASEKAPAAPRVSAGGWIALGMGAVLLVATPFVLRTRGK